MHDVFHPAGAETWKTSVTSTITTDAVLVISRKFCGRKMIFYDQPSYHMILVLSLDWLLSRQGASTLSGTQGVAGPGSQIMARVLAQR